MKTRFAPSPTGFIHLGNARTALFSALLAQKAEGTFLLRMEDTDEERSEKRFEEALMYDLQWLGLVWQEGAGVGGRHEPYWQSQRASIYEEYYQQLIDEGYAYPCFCTEAQLSLSRKLQQSRGLPPKYSGTCRSLSKEEIQKKMAEGLKPTLRLRVADDEVIEFEDFVKGLQKFKGSDMGDFIIRRSNGGASFMFCNAIDDALMGLTHVMRGEDHLTNTPRQLIILKMLKLRQPNYGHISLILGNDGAPLSKRNGSHSIADLRQLGYLPLAVVNYLARLGHYYEDNSLMSMETLAAQFKESNLSKSPARYDEAQLLHWQKVTLQQLSESDFWHWVGETIKNQIPETKRSLFYNALKGNILFPVELESWIKIFFEEIVLPENSMIQSTPPSFFKLAAEEFAKNINPQVVCDVLKNTLGVKGKSLFMPLRLALTGQEHGPELAPICELLGAEKIQHRLKHAEGMSCDA